MTSMSYTQVRSKPVGARDMAFSTSGLKRPIILKFSRSLTYNKNRVAFEMLIEPDSIRPEWCQ